VAQTCLWVKIDARLLVSLYKITQNVAQTWVFGSKLMHDFCRTFRCRIPSYLMQSCQTIFCRKPSCRTIIFSNVHFATVANLSNVLPSCLLFYKVSNFPKLDLPISVVFVNTALEGSSRPVCKKKSSNLVTLFGSYTGSQATPYLRSTSGEKMLKHVSRDQVNCLDTSTFKGGRP
jgi:hypothetical protein